MKDIVYHGFRPGRGYFEFNGDLSMQGRAWRRVNGLALWENEPTPALRVCLTGGV